MATLKTNLNITTDKDYYSMGMTDSYDQIFRSIESVDSTDAFITIASLGKSLAGVGGSAGQRLKGAKLIVIKNNSAVGAEIQLRYAEWKNNSNVDETNSVDLGPGSATTSRQLSLLLGANEYIVLPNQWGVGYAEDTSGGNAKTIDNKGGYDVHTTLAIDSTADIDSATSAGIVGNGSNTTIYLEPYTSATNCTANLFRVGDLVRVDDEIMEVTAIGDKSDLANNYLTVVRAKHGSSAASDHSDDEPLELAFFNTQSDFDAFTYTQTNSSGRLTTTNLCGYGRSLTYPTGIVKGSFAMKFYKAGYQELGLSGVTSASNSGLTASTAYQFQVAVDGGSAYDVDITTDASDLSVGKLINLIQAQFNAAYYASSGNLKNKRLTVAIVNGDIRFTSGQRTRASAVALSDSSGGDTDLWGVGIIPAVADVETAIAAVLPEDTVYDRESYISSPNSSVFTYDDGKGNLIGGEASGTINYETGALDITGPPNAEPVFSFAYDSAHSGGANESSNQQNTIKEISARSCNSKLNAEIEILGFV